MLDQKQANQIITLTHVNHVLELLRFELQLAYTDSNIYFNALVDGWRRMAAMKELWETKQTHTKESIFLPTEVQ